MRALAIVMLAAGTASADPILASSASYACARTHDGHVACWGQTPGEAHPVPVVVPGLSDIAGIAAAPTRLVAWSTKGDAWQWTGTLARLPVHDVVELAADVDATCARHRDGRVECWLGANPPTSAVAGATQLAVAGRKACARIGDTVSCWTLGSATTEVVTDARGALAIAGVDRGTRGATFVAVLPGKLVGWSYAWDPDGTHAHARAPVPMPALTDTTQIAIGDTEACALGRTVTCWADDARPLPRTIDAAGAIAIAVGAAASCAAMPDRHVRCWGDQSAIGTGVPAFSMTPSEVAGISDAVELDAAGESACVRRANGRVACWGARLSDDWNKRTRVVDVAPREVPGITDATALFVGLNHACVRRGNGRVACWGLVGNATHAAPTDMPSYAHATWIGDGDQQVCALLGTRLECGGRLVDRFHRVPAKTTEIFIGSWYRGEYLCARGGGGASCQERWSAHGESDLSDVTFAGLDTASAVAMPMNQEIDQLCTADASGAVSCMQMPGNDVVAIPGVTGVRAFAEGPVPQPAGAAARCAVTDKHVVACWTEPSNVWTIAGITDATAVAGTELFACALRGSGKVACWGDSDYVGNGARQTRDTPVTVPGPVL